MEENELAAAFAALGKDTRLRILKLIAAAGGDGLAAGDIARRLEAPASTLSFHLTAMVDAGVIIGKRRGREMHYALRSVGLQPLLMFLARLEDRGTSRIAAALENLLPSVESQELPMTAAYNVTFVCTRNSARSIMAEAILEKIAGGRFRAYSAGTDPASEPMPEVIERLKVLGHDVSRLRSKHWHELTGPDAPRMDFVLTLCDLEQGEQCPDFGPNPITAAWPFPDPAKFVGSPTERTSLINELYGMIRRRLEAFVNLPISSLDQLSLAKRIADLAN